MGGWTPTRRRLLGAVGAAGMTVIAGCGSLLPGGGTLVENMDPTVATEAATQAENWRRSRVETAARLADEATIRDGTDGERQRFLADEGPRLAESVYNVHLVELDSSAVLASTDEANVEQPLNIREAPWQVDRPLEYGENGVFVSWAVEALGRSLMSFVAPVETDETGQVVLVVQADLDVLGGDLQTPDSGFTQIVSEEGRIVADSQEVSELERNDGILPVYTSYPDELSVLQDGLAGGSDVVRGIEVNDTTVADHRDFLIGFAPVTGAKWVVFAHERVASDD